MDVWIPPKKEAATEGGSCLSSTELPLYRRIFAHITPNTHLVAAWVPRVLKDT